MVDFRLPFVDYENEGLVCPEQSLTHQSFAEECDYNNVMAKWVNSGLITHLNPATPMFLDVSDIGDYQSSLDLIRSAQEQFNELPSKVRDRFDNDPAKLLAFLSDPRNQAEAVALGLAEAVETSDSAPAAKPEVSTADAGGV